VRKHRGTLEIHSKVRKGLIPPLSHLFSILLPILLLVRICIETLRVTLIAQWGYDRAAVFTAVDVVPANATKERMTFDSICTAADVS
jgi:hypothetical protein